MKKIEFFLFVIFFLVSFGVRLYNLRSPIADWHSWRQADTAAVARNFLRFGIDPLHPRYDDLSNIQTGKDNPAGWRMVEFPLYQTMGALLSWVFPALTIEVSLRLISIFATSASVILLGLLLRALIDPWTGLIGAALYAILPFSIYYGRTILPDPLATFFALLSLLLLVIGNKKTQTIRWTTLAALAGAISLLIRPMAFFLLFPVPYLIYQEFIRLPARHRYAQALARGFVYSFISLLPVLLWRQWILQFPEGIPASDWLFNKDGIRFKGAWFYWLFAKRIGELILGYWGLIPFGLGIVLQRQKQEGWFSTLFLLGGLAYLIIFAGGNVQHDYYQALLVPIVVWFTAKGVRFLLKKSEGMSTFFARLLALTCIVFLWIFSWYTIRTYFWINRPEIVEAGNAADHILPKDAKVIAPYSGDTTFLYQTKRQGWPIGFTIDMKISQGATHYVTVAPTDADGETKDLASRYTVLVRNDRYAIIDLTKPK